MPEPRYGDFFDRGLYRLEPAPPRQRHFGGMAKVTSSCRLVLGTLKGEDIRTTARHAFWIGVCPLMDWPTQAG